MSDTAEANTSTQDGNETSGATSAAGDEFKPITSQDELNRIIGERVKRAKPADYDDLRSKAARLAEIEQANMTEAQKAAEQLSAAERRAADAEARAVRREIALEHQLDKDDAALLDGMTDEDAMRRLAERLAKAAQGVESPVGFRVDHSGRRPGATPNKDDAARAVFGI